MSAVLRQIGRAARAVDRLRAGQGGSATIEFLIWFPVFVTIFLSSIEAAILLARVTLFERGVELSVRNVRLGIGGIDDTDKLRADICSNVLIIPDCNSDMFLDLRPIDTTTWDFPATNVPCVNREENIDPLIDFTLGNPHELMLVRACIYVNLLFPTTPLGLQIDTDAEGGTRVLASSAFVNEPS